VANNGLKQGMRFSWR